MEEVELVKQSKNGDMQAFGELYDRFVRVIFEFIYYKTGNKETAEDLVSETFFKAIKNMPRVDPAKSFSAWLYRIALNTVRDYYRVHGKRKTYNVEDFWDIADTTDVSSDVNLKFLKTSVSKYLKNLTARERDIVILRVWQCLSYKEIVDIVGGSEASLKMSYSRAIGKLRKIMPREIYVLILCLL